eukprot:jgi/Astpho2/7339/Aster-01934
MTTLSRLRARAHEITLQYFELNRLAEVARPTELRAAVQIQAAARGFLQRKYLKQFIATVTCIQCCWRGYKGRQRFSAAQEVANQGLRQGYFDARATCIQRHFRGFWSRKYVHSFYERQAYLAAVARKNAEVKALCQQEYESALRYLQEQDEAAARQRFERQASRLHHLVSTSAIPSIYASPYAVLTGSIPRVEGVHLEEHIRTLSKSLRGSTPRSRTRQRHQLPQMKARRHKGPGLTLQAASKYDAVHEAERLDRLTERALMTNSGRVQQFSAAVKRDDNKLPPLMPRTEYSPRITAVTTDRGSAFDEKMAKVSDRPFSPVHHKQQTFQETLVM